MADMPMSDGGSRDDFVAAAADESVRGALAGGRGLRDFLATIDALTLGGIHPYSSSRRSSCSRAFMSTCR